MDYYKINQMNVERKALKIISKVSSTEISDIHPQSYFIRDLNFTILKFSEICLT